MENILANICENKRAHVAIQKLKHPLSEIEKLAKSTDKTRGFSNKINLKIQNGDFALIAEIKKASPSKGLIRPDFNPIQIAQAYESGGASCISVLTDQPYFQGKDSDLVEARNSVSLPALRKDFIIDQYQIPESRYLGADCILLIIAALDGQRANELASAAHEWGMDVLVEVHDQDELERALLIDSDLIGINNRNLKTLKVDLSTTELLAPLVPSDRVLISESGLFTNKDLIRMSEVGAKSFLIGESLMRQDNINKAVKKLLASE
jgi:indole-3-glycerol phosphate synthase